MVSNFLEYLTQDTFGFPCLASKTVRVAEQVAIAPEGILGTLNKHFISRFQQCLHSPRVLAKFCINTWLAEVLSRSTPPFMIIIGYFTSCTFCTQRRFCIQNCILSVEITKECCLGMLDKLLRRVLFNSFVEEFTGIKVAKWADLTKETNNISITFGSYLHDVKFHW